MGLFGPGRATGEHTEQAVRERQREARREDANASTRPNQVTLDEIRQNLSGRRD